MSQVYKILIADDHPVVRDGLRNILESQSDFKVELFECCNGQEVVNLVVVEEHQFDLILLDISMPVMGGLEALEILKNEMEIATSVLMLTTFDNEAFIKKSTELGASGYVLKNSSSDELLLAINKVLKKQKYFSKEIAEILLRTTDKNFQKNVTELTGRQKQILVLLTKEKTNEEIAFELHLSVRTVESHRQRILKKLDLHSTIGLIKYAVKNGFDVE